MQGSKEWITRSSSRGFDGSATGVPASAFSIGPGRFIPIYLPPLRERKEDIPSLVNYFIGHLQQKTGKKIQGVNSRVMNLFMKHNWPGNIRELKSVLEYAFVIADFCNILPDHLPERLNFEIENQDDAENFLSASNSDICDDLDEKKTLIAALRLSNGNKTEAAKILGVHRMTVWNRMKKYDIRLSKKINHDF